MSVVVVKTKKELENAYEKGYDEIIVKGKLAKQLHRSKKIVGLSATSIAAIAGLSTISVVTAPVTGGISLVVAATPVAVVTGVEVVFILADVIIGIALIIAIFKDYEEIDVDMKNHTLKLRKKSK